MLILVHFLIWTDIVVRHRDESFYYLFNHITVWTVFSLWEPGENNSKDNWFWWNVDGNLAVVKPKRKEILWAKQENKSKRNHLKEINENIMKVNIFKKSLKQINAVLRNQIISAKKRLHKLF